MDTSGTTRIVGVIGGMGPEATVDFMSKVIALTPARCDQDHVRMIVDSNPKTPDRQAAIKGDDSAVRAALVAMAKQLQVAGADFIVMPCNTAHAFVDDAIRAIDIPFVHIVEETVREVEHAYPQAQQVGILATDACLVAGVYQKALQAAGKTPVFPGADDQHQCMQLIGLIKAGDTSEAVRKRMVGLAERLIEAGADVVIAGCTEIPLVLNDSDIKVALISSTDVLAKRTVAIATGVAELPRTD